MTGPAPEHATYYRAAEVAERLHCSEWWVKDQARRRRIPFCWIGGSYLFTEEHISEIVRLFEVRPGEPVGRVFAPRGSSPAPSPELAGPGSVVRLHARAPRRVRSAVGTAA